eukprot:9849935-Prorocentrum_lima.AAC.1
MRSIHTFPRRSGGFPLGGSVVKICKVEVYSLQRLPQAPFRRSHRGTSVMSPWMRDMPRWADVGLRRGWMWE